MATSKTAKTAVKKEPVIVKDATPVVSEETSVPKKFANDELVMCRSVTNGELFMKGDKTGTLYRWAEYGDEEGVEYQDLLYAVRTRTSPTIYEPRIIIEDDEFVEQNKQVNDFYESMYTIGDFVEILDLPVAQLKKVVADLPLGAKNALKGIVARRIDDGSFDSVNKIKVLDEVLGTNLFIMLTNS